MSRSVCIVQARTGSTRLPGKVLLELGGRTVLSHVLERCQAIPGIDAVCCASPEGADCDLVVAEAERCGTEVFRGSETDVLDRYYRAAKMLQADFVLRVTSDCPLIDPVVCGRVLAEVTEGRAGFAANNIPPTWPHGLDCEAFTFALLERAAAGATTSFEREHVSPFMREAADVRRANVAAAGKDMSHHRWTLDTPQDHAFLQALFARLPQGPESWDHHIPLALVETDPDLAVLNAGHEHPLKNEHSVSR
ncbi:MAG: glycosyltransferase family protein [Rhodospirillales bacterium]|jgi:spore coat polysaccharide biosynthesis protein SpsF (cytidylyltransferase family)|nr:spore coat polysaccharide biosynthesis protein F [Chloroflexota bacterium]MDP6172540.1 glycosyltransferase family protein [Rhodospirillales bacterium]